MTQITGFFPMIFLVAFSPAVAEPIIGFAPIKEVLASSVTVDERRVPNTEELDIPLYPGSLFCTVNRGKWGDGGWVETHFYSTESYEQVVAWYRAKLPKWHCKEWVAGFNFNCSDKDPGEAGNYDPETFNSVEILKTAISGVCKVSGVQTAITVYFQPD